MSTRGCAPSCTRVQREMSCTRVTSASRTLEVTLVRCECDANAMQKRRAAQPADVDDARDFRWAVTVWVMIFMDDVSAVAFMDVLRGDGNSFLKLALRVRCARLRARNSRFQICARHAC